MSFAHRGAHRAAAAEGGGDLVVVRDGAASAPAIVEGVGHTLKSEPRRVTVRRDGPEHVRRR